MTVDEFLVWDSPGPYLWQLIDGVPVAMVPDLAITCSAGDIPSKAVKEPVMPIEILSPTKHAETWRDVWAYSTIPSPRDIVRPRSNQRAIKAHGTDRPVFHHGPRFFGPMEV